MKALLLSFLFVSLLSNSFAIADIDSLVDQDREERIERLLAHKDSLGEFKESLQELKSALSVPQRDLKKAVRRHEIARKCRNVAAATTVVLVTWPALAFAVQKGTPGGILEIFALYMSVPSLGITIACQVDVVLTEDELQEALDAFKEAEHILEIEISKLEKELVYLAKQ